MKKRIILCGPGASGKDHFRKKVESKSFKFAVTFTSRPIRDGEVNGVDAEFVSKEDFEALIASENLVEYDQFNGWYYGTTKDVFETADIFIMTPRGISQLSTSDRSRCLVIYLATPRDIRESRLTQRYGEGHTEIHRRLEADDRDFQDFTDFDILISNSDF